MSFITPPHLIQRDRLIREAREILAPSVNRGSNAVKRGKSKSYDPRTQKRCIKCRQWKDREGEGRGFGTHDSSSDGLQSICFTCKNKDNNEARNKNPVVRLRHHIGTRCLTQLGDLAPLGFTEHLQDYLGYRVKDLVKHLTADLRVREGEGRKLRDALNEGYHVDHIRPLSSFKVVRRGGAGKDPDEQWIDWEEFRRCWAIPNLSAIPAQENLKKGARYSPGASACKDPEL